MLLGHRAARYSVIAMMLAQYIVVCGLVWLDWFGPLVLVSFLSVGSMRLVFRVFRDETPATPPPDLPPGVWPLWYVAIAFHHNARFGVCYLLGLAADTLLVTGALG